MIRIKGAALMMCCAAVVLSSAVAQAAPARMSVSVDATDLSRKLLHAEIRLPVTPGPLTLWYPKWVPGTHAPSGPVQNLGGLSIETASGETLAWERDLKERHQYHLEVPKGVKELRIRLDYICNQPTTNTMGVDSYGTALVGIVNWNTCLLYPDGAVNDVFEVDLSLTLPAGWHYATALDVASEEGGRVEFERATLQRVVDSPLICGKYFRHFPLETEGIVPMTLELVAESSSGLQVPDKFIDFLGRMGSEAGALFGGAPFDEYKLLLVATNEFPKIGLEHLRSSLNGVGERDLFDDDKLQGWVGNLLPHEFVHAWSGKYRRPAGMDTRNYNTPKDTKLLWVYEGLDTYLANVLSVRGGLWTPEHFREALARTISGFIHQTGRQWRSLEDTAVASYQIRQGSKSWGTLRRSQDYYHEGALIWLEADAIIRLETNGARSLDDFCELFMGPGNPKQPVVPYTEADIIADLNEVLEYDWAGFIARHIKETQEELPLDFVARIGYRLQYATERSANQKMNERNNGNASALDSIGISVGSGGVVSSSVVTGMAAERAGISPGMKIIGVNGRTFSLDRFRDGIADSVTKRNIEFLIAEGDVLRTITVDYADGSKYLELVRDEDRPDIFGEIMKPLVPGE